MSRFERCLQCALLLLLACSIASAQSSATFTNTGTYTNTQMNEYIQSLLNGCATSEFTTVQGAGHYATDALSGCNDVPSTSTQYGANAVAGFAVANSASTNTVAGYFQTRCIVSGGYCWGINPVVIDYPFPTGATNLSLLGAEVDVQPQGAVSAYTTVIGVMADLFAPTAGNYGEAFLATSAQSGLWNVGLATSDGKASIFALAGSATTSAGSASQSLGSTRGTGATWFGSLPCR